MYSFFILPMPGREEREGRERGKYVSFLRIVSKRYMRFMKFDAMSRAPVGSFTKVIGPQILGPPRHISKFWIAN